MTRKFNKSRPFRDINLVFTSGGMMGEGYSVSVSYVTGAAHMLSHMARFLVHGMAVAVYQHGGAGVSLATEANARAGDC